jgi:aspartate/glutamate racemase
MNAVQPLVETFKVLEPEVELIHLLDEGLLLAVNEQGGVTPQILDSFGDLLQRAMTSNVQGILLSCSAFSPYVPTLASKLPVPLLSVDREMLEQAVRTGERIGVVATVSAAGPTTAKQLEELATAHGVEVSVAVEIVTEAFDELKKGRGHRHDALIRERAEKLASKPDVIILAQISMARALKQVSHLSVPVLASPEISVKAMLKLLTRGGRVQ